ncbi:unnamed protein product [Rhodiola kirilowii]
MVAGMDLPRPKDAASLRLRAAKITLQMMRMQGHDYLDLRQDGKRIIYLCILCHKACYSEPILFQHLNGSGHKKMLTNAKLTMCLQNPWPFNDGMVFFNPIRDELCAVDGSSSQVRFIEASDSSKNVGAIVKYRGKFTDRSDCSTTADSCDFVSDGLVEEKNPLECDENPDLVVPHVLWKGDVCHIELKYLGLAQIGARFYKEKNGKDSDKIRRIWCQWLGETNIDGEDMSSVPDLDFAVVTLRYDMSISMGWEDELEEIKYGGSKKKKQKSFSDPEDTSVSLANYDEASLKDSAGTRCKEISASWPVLSHNSTLCRVNVPSDELSLTGSTSNKDLRKEIRKRQRVAVRRMCEVCKHKMQPGKDVAVLLNLKTGKLACSSRNLNGAFHVFHVSCLLHWILLCKYETLTYPVESPKWKHIAKKRKTTKISRARAVMERADTRIHSVVCPACQGTGKHIKGDILEKNPILPSQMFKYMIQTFDGRREWMKDPEILPNCSIGLHYPPKSEEIVEELSATLGLLRFFTVDDPEWGVAN